MSSASGAFATLVEVGARLRRGRGAGTALAVVKRDEAIAFLASIDVDIESRRLAQAIDDAFEATLTDDAGEREVHVAAALEGLASRDRIESALAAIEELLASRDEGDALDEDARRRFDDVRQAMAHLDRAARPGAAPLVALNEARRRERDALADAHRARAWWWSSRAECDALIALLRNETADAAHLASCADCRNDRDRMSLADTPPLAHLTADELWSFDVGAMLQDERARALRHAARCADCKLALDALTEAEGAIAHASEPPPRDDDVVAEHAAFVVRIRRDAKRVRVLVDARHGVHIKDASLAGLASAPSGTRPRRTERGLELAVAASAASAARADRVKLVVELASERVEIEIDLARRR